MLFQWNSADHVPYSDSEQPLPASASTPWDWFHINAVHLDSDGNLLIDSRATWTAYKVDRRTGATIWQLGGKHSSFTEQAAPGQTLDSAGEIFSWQHDPEAIGNNEYTFFDNDSEGTPLLPSSREVTVRLNVRDRVATLVSSDNQPEGLSAASQGNAQTLRDGDIVVGWGSLPYFSEFDTLGTPRLQCRVPRRGEHLPGLPAAVQRDPRMVEPGPTPALTPTAHTVARRSRTRASRGDGSVVPGAGSGPCGRIGRLRSVRADRSRPTSPTAR